MSNLQKTETSFHCQYRDFDLSFNDTIVAIATPPGKGGIGIIRISGKNALVIVQNIFIPVKNKHKKFKIESHRIYYGKIVDPIKKKITIDEVLLLPMIAPRSYTKEDVVEIHAHSGYAVLEKILNIILQQHARIAEPGEFTKRAFLNGRLDLTQAEAVIDLINAETESARKIASCQLEGRLKDKLRHIQDNILKSLAEIEAQIEFSDDQGEDYIEKKFWIEYIYEPLKNLEKSAYTGQILKDGIRIALAGKPNVGKSSIMNRLLCQERSIVTPFPGTTRDHIEESFNIQGIKVRLIDTAGIRDSRNPVEIIGIQKTREKIQNADLILMVYDISRKPGPEDFAIFKSIREKKKILVFNKKDLIENEQVEEMPEEWRKEEKVIISALKDKSMDALRAQIIRSVITEGFNDESKEIIVSNVRQKQNIENASKAIENAMRCYDSNGPMEIVAFEFQEAKKEIDQALGVDISEDILDRVFKNFCIGK